MAPFLVVPAALHALGYRMDQLTPEQQKAAASLGYEQSTWDNSPVVDFDDETGLLNQGDDSDEDMEIELGSPAKDPSEEPVVSTKESHLTVLSDVSIN